MYAAVTATPTLSNPTQAFSVTEINTMIADVLESGLPGFLWVEGEISNLSVAASGHRYLSLKDSGATVSCALFRGSAQRINSDILQALKNGDKVVIKAKLSVYKPRGSYQLIISDIEPAGFGALAKAFAALKSQLDNAGLTASERKRPIPTWPKHIAVVTSETGAAIRDVLTTLQRRAPFIPVRVYPTLVQGDSAPEQIIQALYQANNDNAHDDVHDNGHDNGHNNTHNNGGSDGTGVIILARGGGSLEDLMAFNDEAVAMAVVNSRLPVVTGVGHETDVTIVDFVSDYRAPTPTAAAEIVSPDKAALKATLQKQQQRLLTAINRHLQQRQQQASALSQRLQIQHPARQLQQQSQRVDELAQRLQRTFDRRLQQQRQQLRHYQQQLTAKSPQQSLQRARERLNAVQSRLQQVMQQRLMQEQQRLSHAERQIGDFILRFETYRQQLKGLQARLTLLSPLGVLERGYALTFDADGQLLRSVNDFHSGATISVRLADGEVTAIVDKQQ